MNWYLKCLKQYADFNGRARRTEYWMFILLHFIFLFSLTLLSVILTPFLIFVYFIATFIPYLAVCVRRLHDVNKSGWFLFIHFIPLIGPIILLVLFVTSGDIGPNEYGPDPKGETGESTSGALDSELVNA